MSKFHVLVIHDGKPGHISQAVGLARLISKQYPCDISLQKTRLRSNLFVRTARKFCFLKSTYFNRLSAIFFYKRNSPVLLDVPTKPSLSHEPPALIISFGGKVLALNVFLSKVYGAKNIVIGNTYGVDTNQFSAIIKRSTKKDQANIIGTGITLCNIDKSAVNQMGNNFIARLPGVGMDKPRVYWGLLIGGDGSGYQYDDSDWSSLVQLIKWYAEKYNIQWLISTSRRTPKPLESMLLEQLPLDIVGKAIYYHQKDDDPIRGLLGASEVLFVTEDSLTMLNEAVAMDKPVVSISPALHDKKKSHFKAVKYLRRQKLIQRVVLDKPSELRPFHPAISYSEHIARISVRLDQYLSNLDHPTVNLIPLEP